MVLEVPIESVYKHFVDFYETEIFYVPSLT